MLWRGVSCTHRPSATQLGHSVCTGPQVGESSVDGSEFEKEKTRLSVEIKQLLAQPDDADEFGPISLHCTVAIIPALQVLWCFNGSFLPLPASKPEAILYLQIQAEDLSLDVGQLEKEKAQLLEEREQLFAQLDDADKAGLEAESLLQATCGKIETLEKARNAAVQVSSPPRPDGVFEMLPGS